MKFRWSWTPDTPASYAPIARDLGVTPLLVRCLHNRKLREPALIQQFLEPRLRHLADPFLLPGMRAAVDRLLGARVRNEPLILFGDYDVDGVTATAILLEVLRPLGWRVSYYLPRRFEDGYGLTREALGNCLQQTPATLLVALDCGSTSTATIQWLGQQGIDVIVVDHHQVASPPPPALALVNPLAAPPAPPVDVAPLAAASAASDRARPPFAELCSAGLAFRLAHGLVKRGRETGLPGAGDFDLRPLLDLVALGTIADLVPLQDENRILVSAGLERLRQTQRPGLVALKRVARCTEWLGSFEAGFQLAPRLNAAGRLETAQEALDLLLAPDAERALALALKLDAHNLERKRIEREIFDQAVALIRTRFNGDTDFVIVEGHPQWHIGVVGIVAARLLHHFNRPTIVVGGDGLEWRGSGRSIAGFDLAGALSQCGELLSRHGGHAMAAGLTLNPKNLDALRARLNGLASKALGVPFPLAPLHLDGEVKLEELTLASLEELRRLEPLGQGNPSVQFFARNLLLQRPPRRLGAEQQHVKLWISDGASSHEAIWWQAGDQVLPSGRFDLAFAPQIDTYRGRQSVLLKMLDWRPAAPQDS